MAEDAEFPLPLENGRALTMVGEPRRAIEALTPKVAAMADYPRDVVLTQAYLAQAHQAAGSRDEAEAYAASPRTESVLAGLAN